MGYGTGVMRAYYAVTFMRGLTTGVAGTTSLFLSQHTGVPQHWIFFCRGLGLTLGPLIFGKVIGRMTWSGESQSGWALFLLCKSIAEVAVSRVTSGSLLYLSFFVIGIVSVILDVSAAIHVTRIHGKNCGLPFLIYYTLYGIGCIIAPWLSIGLMLRSWDFLAFLDFLTAVVVGGRRLVVGKPRNWKAKVRGLVAASPKWQKSEPAEEGFVPFKVLRAGLLGIFIVQAAETAMSSWAFTYAKAELGIGAQVAALFPSVFYASFTITRVFVMPVSHALLPSTFVQLGALVGVIASLSFYLLANDLRSSVRAGLDPELLAAPDFEVPVIVDSYSELNVKQKSLLAIVALSGAGSCPLYPMLLSSMRQHGNLSLQQQSWFSTVASIGVALGVWAPGVLSLPTFSLAGTSLLFLIISSYQRVFPWRKPVEAYPEVPELVLEESYDDADTKQRKQKK
mmetsp:Transcript_39434/g.92757  ORF Transcript_39434/g.92757 Transcript_39434/m.92757 type:complete len:452 (-) Transcript_39434:137-1492(-)|eukprot:CAMPEP_0178428712 /NCGR_PEP_ID=MMETSP0689_2-20121128/30422_1 /TAXON_ID=160604 /ORGANISM="Amphidinium massartii, Strain CS-259" /LENGTH=451 /DNA_ID=CAMNT_0020050499 /DNA_START=89 /DNA_END=1444 /DNA_ORIENTATION=+